MLTRRLLVVPIITLALGAASCSGGGDESAPPTSAVHSKLLEVPLAEAKVTGLRVSEPVPKFEWAAADGATTYVLRLASAGAPIWSWMGEKTSATLGDPALLESDFLRPEDVAPDTSIAVQPDAVYDWIVIALAGDVVLATSDITHFVCDPDCHSTE
ncbi:MAG: hypothetical protein HYU28_10935 [Actinobacteria bacterium]|nr:hypothetical protein [Actinomycetota bacterium]